MEKDSAFPSSRAECDETLLSGVKTNDNQIELANTIKSFHYSLQRRMSNGTGDMTREGKQDGEEEEEGEVKRWFRLIAEEGERMKAYSTAMHDIATGYWVSHQQKKGICENCTHSSPAVVGVAQTHLKRQRDTEEVNDTRKHGGALATGSSRYNDRVEYSIHCVADYFLGMCLSFPHSVQKQEQQQQQLNHHQDNDMSYSEIGDVEQPLLTTGDAIYVQLPRVAAIAIKAWRRAFYTAHGRQASKYEVESAAYNALSSFASEGVKGNGIDKSVALEYPADEAELPKCCQVGAGESVPSLTAIYMSMSRREVWRRFHLGRDTPQQPPPLQVLDVGSCYGPFEGKSVTNGVLQVPLAVTALDLYPFEGSNVIRADWLAVRFYEKGNDMRKTKGVGKVYEDCCGVNEYETTAGTEPLVRHADETDDGKGALGRPLWVARGQFDVVFFCLMLSFLPHPRLRYRACLYAHLALKDGGLLVIVSTRTQGARRSIWIEDWITCIEGIGFKRVHKNVMGQIVGMSFRKEEVTESNGDIAGWVGRMMARPEAEFGLCTVGDNYHQSKREKK